MRLSIVLAVAIAVLCVAVVRAEEEGNPSISISGVVDLTPANFDQYLDGSRHVFLEAYAPWCFHCKNFVNDFTRLGAAYAKSPAAHGEVLLAKVNADEHKELASRLGVQGFPTFKWYSKGSTTGEDYNGGRAAEDVVDFIRGKTGVSINLPKVSSSVHDLTSATFASTVLAQTQKARLVEFFAPWCGHCKKLTPIYEKLASVFQSESDVVIAKVDATKEPELAQQYNVQGYPTILFFAPGSNEPTPYNEGRELDAFVNFINSNAGTKRDLDGTLSAEVGRVVALDVIAMQLSAGKNAKEVLAELKDKARKAPEDDYYLRVAEKAAADSGYVAKETARLEKLIGKQAASPKQLDDMKKRLNVLRVFGGAA
jgi:protein disulfide-isomerase A6